MMLTHAIARRRKLPKRQAPALDADSAILPLINIVFLLLIFFMVAGTLIAADPFDIEPPASANASQQERGEQVIQIAADGRLALNGEELPRDQLLLRLQDAATPPGARTSAGQALAIKADAAAQIEVVIGLLRALEESGIGDVRLMTVQP